MSQDNNSYVLFGIIIGTFEVSECKILSFDVQCTYIDLILASNGSCLGEINHRKVRLFPTGSEAGEGFARVNSSLSQTVRNSELIVLY